MNTNITQIKNYKKFFDELEAQEAKVGEIKGVENVLRLILTEREYKVIKMHYGLDGLEPVSLERTGNQFGICREQVRNVIKLAKRKITLFGVQKVAAGDSTPNVVTTDSHITELNLETTVENMLRRNGICTVADLLKCNYESIKKVGPASKRKIDAALKRAGLS